MKLSTLAEGMADAQKEAVRRMLRERVPPFSRNKLVHDPCEDV
jgi:hypothetical protein